MLAVLRVLGRDWCFDDVAEATLMSETTARKSFHIFCDNFTSKYYSEYIKRPEGEELEKVMAVYSMMGLHGCVGSTDCVHVKWDKCPTNLRVLCTGKEGFPSLVYSVVVDHT